MFKRKLLTALVTTAIVGLGGYAINASAASDPTATANAVILTPLSILETAPMNFGTIAPDGGGGIVTLTTGGTIPIVPTGFVVSGVPAAGAFTVTGETGLSYAISFPGSPYTLDEVGIGTDTMTVDSFTTSITATIASPRILPAATDTFTVGANLNIGVAQTAGTYQGVYIVQVDYQ